MQNEDLQLKYIIKIPNIDNKMIKYNEKLPNINFNTE